jgi:NAD(P)-dependent dehydrogenase (short-subunit alcohol dehydrogenase family)
LSAAFEYANKGIVINAVCPGMVDTPLTMRMTNNYDPEIVKRMISQAPKAETDRLCLGRDFDDRPGRAGHLSGNRCAV